MAVPTAEPVRRLIRALRGRESDEDSEQAPACRECEQDAACRVADPVGGPRHYCEGCCPFCSL